MDKSDDFSSRGMGFDPHSHPATYTSMFMLMVKLIWGVPALVFLRHGTSRAWHAVTFSSILHLPSSLH